VAGPVASEPACEGLRSEGRDGALFRNAGDQFRDVAQERKLSGQVDQAGSIRGESGPQIDVAEGVVVNGTQAALVVVGEKLGFVRG
jgi:hypothetical protein